MSAVTSHAVADSVMVTSDRSVDELDRAICCLVRQLNTESYRLLLLVREFDDRFGWAKWSFASCAEWLAWRCGISLSAAREKVRTAQALRQLSAISVAFADGRLSYSKVRALTRVAHEHDEDLLLAYALEATAAQVEERCRQIRNASPESVDGARRVWERRALTVWRSEATGTLRLTIELPIEEGELIAQAIDCAVAAGEVTTGVEPDGAESKGASWRAQQADALVAVAKAYLDGSGAASERSGTADRYQVVVHVDEESLRGGAGRAELPIATIERLTCDGSVVTVVDAANGAPLDVGRKQRTVSTPLKRAIHARDRGCTFPGCHRKRYLDAHHLEHWAHGGETSLDNLTLLCSHHHRLLHEGGFNAQRNADGALTFARADGRVVPRVGYRVEDFTDDEVAAGPSREGYRTNDGAESLRGGARAARGLPRLRARRGMLLARQRHRPFDDLPQHAAIHVVELVDVEAALAGLVLAELAHELRVFERRPDVQHEAAGARREAHEADVALAAALVFVVHGAEADDRRAPHLRRLARHGLHHRDELVAVAAFDVALDLVDEGDRVDGSRSGLVLCSHRGGLQVSGTRTE